MLNLVKKSGRWLLESSANMAILLGAPVLFFVVYFLEALSLVAMTTFSALLASSTNSFALPQTRTWTKKIHLLMCVAMHSLEPLVDVCDRNVERMVELIDHEGCSCGRGIDDQN